MSPARPGMVHIREVGPRDGLQVEAPLAVEARVALVDALVGAGLRELEAVAFVSPAAVPAMAGAADVLAQVTRSPDVRYVALVPNVKGAELAVEAGADSLSVTVSASPEYNQRNVRMSIEESVAQVSGIAAVAADRPVDVVVSCAFGSPYEGDLAPAHVGRLGDQVLGAGATSLTYADTTGMATPRRVGDLLDEVGVDVGLHLHETRGTGLVNAFAAWERGVARFDTSVGGLGGSPFASGSAGNLATEDLVHLLDDMGVETGVDLDRLLDVSALAARSVGHDVPSRVAAAGPRSRPAEAR